MSDGPPTIKSFLKESLQLGALLLFMALVVIGTALLGCYLTDEGPFAKHDVILKEPITLE